ncbi:MAG: hemerythrin domain-containing protein [Candidatus Altimarinota bacterium]
MDPFVLLKRDHKRLSAYFDDLFAAPSAEKREDLYSQLRKDLKEHIELEERFFHPLLENHNRTLPSLQHAEEEFHQMRDVMRRLHRSRTMDHRWLQELSRLHDLVKHHVRDDRRTFAQVDDLLNYHQQQDIGDQMIQRKEKKHQGLWRKITDFFSR